MRSRVERVEGSAKRELLINLATGSTAAEDDDDDDV
jgi:hypothetical protein